MNERKTIEILTDTALAAGAALVVLGIISLVALAAESIARG